MAEPTNEQKEKAREIIFSVSNSHSKVDCEFQPLVIMVAQALADAAPPLPVDAVSRRAVYAWLGVWRDKMAPDAVASLQNVLGPLSTDEK
jgi:hypothetical protein